ncbi:hypothetical protein E2C01_002430 [Portunus trituberculatus]|uniref:Secreted protein n=1 Tax=Portunus trituberculatus TaxID=210409 RepID=A0A5B7CKC8_PORTR|nr:hypothetical protein [Portunus trituberculatus]
MQVLWLCLAWLCFVLRVDRNLMAEVFTVIYREARIEKPCILLVYTSLTLFSTMTHFHTHFA